MADLQTVWVAFGTGPNNFGRWDDGSQVWWDDQAGVLFTPNPTPGLDDGGLGVAMGQITLRTRPNRDYTLRYTAPANKRISFFELADNSTLASEGITWTVEPGGRVAWVVIPSGLASLAAPKAITPVLATIGTPTTTPKQVTTYGTGGATQLSGWTTVLGATGGLAEVNATTRLFELKRGATEESRIYLNGGEADGAVRVSGPAATAGGLRILLRHPNSGTGETVGVQFTPVANWTQVTIFNSTDGHALSTTYGGVGIHYSRIGSPFVYEAWLIGSAVVARIDGQVVTTGTVTTAAAGTSFGVSSNSATKGSFARVSIAGLAATATGSPAVTGTHVYGGTVSLGVTPAASEILAENVYGGYRTSPTGILTEPLGEGANLIGYQLETQRDIVAEDAAGVWA